jgi:hypothetical protein
MNIHLATLLCSSVADASASGYSADNGKRIAQHRKRDNM